VAAPTAFFCPLVSAAGAAASFRGAFAHGRLAERRSTFAGFAATSASARATGAAAVAAAA